MTEQGEVIADRYGHPAIAERHLEQVLNAVLQHELPRRRRRSPTRLDRGSSTASPPPPAAHYRASSTTTPSSSTYFEQATPIGEIVAAQDRLAAGAGGASRRRSTSSARSPGSSAGCRAATPCPAGTASAAPSTNTSRERPDGLATLQEMYRRWPFWRTLIDNAQMILAKADMTIARLYADLVDDQALADRDLRPDRRRIPPHRRRRSAGSPARRRCWSRCRSSAFDPPPQPLRRPPELHPARHPRRLRAGDEPARGAARPASSRASTGSPRD